MSRPWQIWLAFSLCLVVLLGAAGWVTWTAVDIEQARESFQEQADLEERVRLALWRMDSILTPFLAQESMRPLFTYEAFFPAEWVFACSPVDRPPLEGWTPSPLLLQIPNRVLLHFQIDPAGRLSSPQVPSAEKRRLAFDGCTTVEKVETSSSRLQELSSIVTREMLLEALGEASPHGSVLQARAYQGGTGQGGPAAQRGASEAQVALNLQEFSQRTRNRDDVVLHYAGDNLQIVEEEIEATLMRPVWVAGSLFLLRRGQSAGQDQIQGCWLDWQGLRGDLLSNIRELLPEAELQPSRSESGGTGARLLATLPVVLEPGRVELRSATSVSPVRLPLQAAWVCLILAAGAVGGLLLGVVALSERRAAFASAVTHELRTPLTTFRMYSDMLLRGMLTDEEKRQRYLSTLSSEAQRLSHLVENVLEYARLEKRGTTSGRVLAMELGAVLDRVEPRLRDRAEQDGRELRLEVEASARKELVETDPGAVEQILFNLVDNACKYARPASDTSLELMVTLGARAATLRVRDRGPGVPEQQRKRIFRAFSKSAKDAANSAPGVGLGLSLSRRLARSLGGDLSLESGGAGAVFAVTLPLAKASSG